MDKLIDMLEKGNSGSIKRQRVKELFDLCQSGHGDDGNYSFEVEGISQTYWLEPTPLNEHEDEIRSMLNELPDQFKMSGGGGWSFLNACDDRNGNQWTGLHERMEQLFVLGMGIDLVDYVMPRDFWPMFPGGMPYLVVKL